MQKKLFCFLMLIYNQNMLAATCLSQMVGSPFPTSVITDSISFSPCINNTIFFAGANLLSNNITVYTLNTQTGIVNPVSGSPFNAPDNPITVKFSPLINNSTLFAASSGYRQPIALYTVDTSTGSFSPITATTERRDHINDLVFSPIINNNLYLATADGFAKSVSVYSCNTSGLLTPVLGSPFKCDGYIVSVAYSPVINNNCFLAAINSFDNTYSLFSVNNDGTLNPVNGSPFKTGNGPSSIAFSPVIQNHLFAAITANYDNTLTLYSVDPDTGCFTQNAQWQFDQMSVPTYAAFTVIQNKLILAVTTLSSNVFFFSINTETGALVPLNNPMPTPDFSFPVAVALSPESLSKIYCATANFNVNSISLFQINGAPLLQNAQYDCSTGLVTVSGSQALSNSTITIFADGAAIGTCIADALGNFTGSSTAQLDATNHSITVTQTNNNCSSDYSNVLTIGSLNAPILVSSSLNQADDTISVQGSQAAPGALITIYADGTFILGTGTADESGNFSFNSSDPLPFGTHPITVAQTINNCVSLPSNSISVDPVAPSTPLSIITPQNGALLYNQEPVISGIASPNSAITVTITGSRAFTGNTRADQNGNWSLRVNTPLVQGTYRATVMALDGNDTTSLVTIEFSIALVSQLVQSIINKYSFS